MRFRPLARFLPRSRERIRTDVEDELAFYLEERAAELRAGGLDPGPARAQALREFGDLEGTQRYCVAQDERAERETSRGDRVSELIADARVAWRGMRRAPAMALLAILTLALGIGGTTAMFTVVRAVLLERLPYARSAELIRLYTRYTDGRATHGQIAAGDFVDFRDRQRTLTGLAGFAFGQFVFAGPERSEAFEGTRVTPDFFRVLGAPALLGRTFGEADGEPGAPRVIVLGYDTWRQSFGGDAAVVGRVVRVNGEPATIVGVMPAGFVDPRGAGTLWSVLDLRPRLEDPNRARKFRFMGAVGRLAPGHTVDDAAADLERIADAMAAEHPESNAPFRSLVEPLRDAIVGSTRDTLLVLLGASALLLLLACANVAGLALARAVARTRELAVRSALGAGRARLVRQMLAESLLLSLIGGAAGVALAWWGTHALGRAAARMLPPVGTIDVDPAVLGFAFVVSVVSGVLFGTAPALASTRLDVARALRAGGRGSTADRRTMMPRNLLAVVQIALAVMLAIGAGLFARTLVALQRVDRGYDPTQLLQFEVLLSGARYDSRAAEGAFYDALFARIEALPGVTSAAAIGSLPIYGGSSASLAIRGRLEEEGKLPEIGYVVASDELFDVLRIPVLAGRRFDARVRSDGPPMVIVSESVARRYFPSGDAIGAQVRLGPDPSEPWSEVIGIVADVRLGIAEEARPTVYVNVRQDAWGGAFVLVRAAGDPRALEGAVRRELRAIDPGVPMVNVTTLADAVSERMLSQRVWAQLMSLFAVIALTIAGIGVYGVVAYGVSARAKELGVRTALGARPRDVLLMVLGQGARLAGLGVAIGIVAAALGGRALASMLYGVGALDAWTFTVAAVVIGAIALVASWVPARRATRVDPLTVLRAE